MPRTLEPSRIPQHAPGLPDADLFHEQVTDRDDLIPIDRADKPKRRQAIRKDDQDHATMSGPQGTGQSGWDSRGAANGPPRAQWPGAPASSSDLRRAPRNTGVRLGR